MVEQSDSDLSIQKLIEKAVSAGTFEAGAYYLLFAYIRLKQRELELEHGEVDYE